MSRARTLLREFKSSGGRTKVATVLSLFAVAVLAVLIGVVPAIAGDGRVAQPSGVQPDEVPYGGGNGGCDFVNSAAPYELHINNPMTGVYTGPDPDGTRFSIEVDAEDDYFKFEILDNSDMAVFDAVVNGGSKSAHFDYDNRTPDSADGGAVQTDGFGPEGNITRFGLHAPTKGNSLENLFNLSHVNLCYGINPVADLSVVSKTPLPAADPFIVDVGDTVEFQITIRNDGPLDATGVTIVDDLPTGMEFIEDFTDPDPNNAGWAEDQNVEGRIIYNVGALAVNQIKTVSLFVLITDEAAGGDITNSATVTGDQDDPDPNNDVTDSEPDVTVTADISGTKYHDKDTDGTKDPSNEDGIQYWTITAFPASGDPVSAVTGSDGSYTIEDLAPGTYTVCEAADSDPSSLPVLPPGASGYEWFWTQSEAGTADCTDHDGYQLLGYTVVIGNNGNVFGKDFGNHRQAGIDCSQGDVTLVLGGDDTDDDPHATVVVEEDSPSCADPLNPWLVTFEVGRSDLLDQSQDDFEQFVVFGDGQDPNPNTTITFAIEWDAEPAVYDEDTNQLVVPTTRVSFPDLADIDNLSDTERCNTDPTLPNITTPLCLESRLIAEGGELGTDIQITEQYIALGDPGYFR